MITDPSPGQLDRMRLAAARLRAAEAQPFLALALYALTPVSDPGRGTFGVDEAWRLFIDPERLAGWTVPEVAGVLLHEVGHLVREHPARARTVTVATKLEARLWNIAADAEINDDLHANGVTLPGRLVLPSTLKQPAHRSAEFYYHHLSSEPEVGEVLPSLVEVGDCGSGCHGVADPTSAMASAAGLPPGVSPVEAMLLRRRVAEEVMRLAGLRPGTVPAGWVRWAEATLRPQLDWRKLLATTIRSSVAAVAGSADYSYRRPPRRRVAHVVLPSMQRPIPRVAIVIDTSGSVGPEMLNVAWGEVHGCLRHLGVRKDLMSIFAVDTVVQRLRAPVTRRVALTGGGGTDMRAGIAAALTARPRNDLVIVLTDGMTPWPERRPQRPVVIALLPGEHRSPCPAWARTIDIPAIPVAPSPTKLQGGKRGIRAH